MTDQPEITPPEPNPESDVLTDAEITSAGATAADAAPVEDDASVANEAPEAQP